MKADVTKPLKMLERKDQQLKRIVANQELDIDILKEVNRGNIKLDSASGSGELLGEPFPHVSAPGMRTP